MKKRLIVSLTFSIGLIVLSSLVYFQNFKTSKAGSEQQDKITQIKNEKNTELAVNDLVEQSKYNIVIFPSPNCESENNICEIGFKNPQNNRYKAKISIRYKDDYLYESDFINPSYQLNEITLNKKMKKGKYPVMGIITVDVDGVLSNINVEMSLDIK